ncbi:uncharacterized protein BDV14DRAFT_202285 [Aspergillus stella-maris]|uniref:uncharacterized protein n=1 Tax=Aspergillus stella-maris TaxID=1810926 RepID=UPI003CCD1B8B
MESPQGTPNANIPNLTTTMSNGTSEIPRCWCKNPIGLNCIDFEHIIPCEACAGSMSPGERAGLVIPGTPVRCKRCNAGNSIFGWDHDGAMAWLETNRHIRKKSVTAKPKSPGPLNARAEAKSQADESDSKNGTKKQKTLAESLEPELQHLLQLSKKKTMSDAIILRRASEMLDILVPMHTELRQALRFIQDPSKIATAKGPDPMRFTVIFGCVSLLRPNLEAGEKEFGKAFGLLLRELLKNNPHANAVEALKKLSRECGRTRKLLEREGLLPK